MNNPEPKSGGLFGVLFSNNTIEESFSLSDHIQEAVICWVAHSALCQVTRVRFHVCAPLSAFRLVN